MKTVFINCSPKKRLSASGFLMGMTGLFTSGRKEKVTLRTKADYARVLDALRDADNAVFSMPLYVDGVPSHVLPFLKETEKYCRETAPALNVYVLANNGFIEGRQNEPLMRTMENFCARSGIRWGGGLGIGGGVMMNVMRIMFFVFLGMAALRILLGGISEGAFPVEPLMNLGRQLLMLLFLGCGIFAYDIRIARCISRGRGFGKHYTRIMLPSFVFIPVADIFFTVMSLIGGGIFRGWFSGKKPAV